MNWVDYGGQDISSFDFIGTDTLMFPIIKGMDVNQTVEEIRRRCGHLVRIKLFCKEDTVHDRDR